VSCSGKGHWYDETKREIEIYTETAIWYCVRYLPVPVRWVLIRDPLGEFEPQALVSTNLNHKTTQILTWLVRRWRMEVTFEEAKAHVGIESQRQWSDLAIARTTLLLFGLYSMVTLMADKLVKNEIILVRLAAWYEKKTPTFSNAIAIVRRCLLEELPFFNVDRKHRDCKSTASIVGTVNRRGLLCRING
jgi:hypothetical protein